MSHFIIHNIVIREDDELFSNYLLSLSYKVEVEVDPCNGTKTYSCLLSEGQYQLVMRNLKKIHEGNES